MATIKLMLNKFRKLKDGSYPLVFQIIHQRKKKLIYTSLHLREEEFDEHREKVLYKEAKRRTQYEVLKMNRLLHRYWQQLDVVIIKLENSYGTYTVDDIVSCFQMINEGDSLSEYVQLRIKQMKQSGREGMIAAYVSTLKSIERYTGSSYVRLSKITDKFIKGYEFYLLKTGLSPNTVCFYLRNIKAIYNYAVKDGYIIAPKESPFRNVQSKPRKTMKRALSRKYLKMLSQLSLIDQPQIELSRDMFMFSFYTRGMAFVDMVFLKKSDIQEGVIRYNRQKTGQLLQILINEPLQDLISKYKSDSPYIFPIISSEEPLAAYHEYRIALRRINKDLKLIAQMLGIETPLTTYVARHSWATQAKEHGVPVSVISEGLGHTSEKTTMIYLKQFDQSVIDQANELVTKL